MDAITYKMITAKCQSKVWEYKRIIQSMSLDEQIKYYSLAVDDLYGEAQILSMAYKIQKVLGFAPGSIHYKFSRSTRGGAKACPATMTLFFSQWANAGAIVHEMVHLICDKETTTKRTYKYDYEEGRYRRQNRSVHNAGFKEYLLMAIDNVIEHRDELGIHLWTAEEVLYGRETG